jgi:DNA-directed RNA polymerase subunit E'/Rpb7
MKAKKNNKPTIIVDLTQAETCEDVRFEFVRAKAKAGVPLTEAEINSVVAYGAHLTLDTIDSFCDQYQKMYPTIEIKDKKQVQKAIKAIESILKPKTPWYKKLWNWVKKPFCKKK